MEVSKTVGYEVKASWHTIARMYNSYAIHYDISISMAFVLMILDSEEGTPSTQIAPSIGMESRSLTRLLKSMEEKELIYKVPDQTDRRQVLIHLTDTGERKKKVSIKTIKQFNSLVEAKIDKKELNVFFNVLEIVNKIAEDNHLST